MTRKIIIVLRILTANENDISGCPKDDCESDDFPVPDVLYDGLDIVMNNITKETFWNRASDDDKKILSLKMQDFTQAEIAKQLGYKTHSAVTKLLQKLK